MSSKRGAHLVELAHVFAGTPIAREWAKKGAVTRRARAAQQKLPLATPAPGATADEPPARGSLAERVKSVDGHSTTKGGHHVD